MEIGDAAVGESGFSGIFFSWFRNLFFTDKFAGKNLQTSPNTSGFPYIDHHIRTQDERKTEASLGIS